MTIGFAYPAQTIWNMWVNLKKSGFDDRCSIRVFEGHIYSLMDDDDYYETSGNRKLINSILFDWDAIRAFALKDEKEESFDWSSRKIKRNDADHQRVTLLSDILDQDLQILVERSAS